MKIDKGFQFIQWFFFCCSVTINKTSDLDNNTDTLKKLTAADKPNNQTKLASVSGTPLPPSQIKCNILKGKPGDFTFARMHALILI